jgi:CRP/FNR family transcriptional regulator, nitrogen oxide reductase regulator
MALSSVSGAACKSNHLTREKYPLSSEAGLARSLQLSSLAPVPNRVRFFQDLSNSEQNVLLLAAQSHNYVSNSVIVEQGRPADRFFMLVKGAARHFFITSAGQKVNLFWLFPGDIFGGVALLTEPSQFIVSTEATKDSKVLVWKRDAIRTLATQYPKLLENALSIASDYLVWYLATHLSLVCDSARERLAHVLYSLSQGMGQKSAEGIELEITNEQLANTANLTQFTVSRLLSGWQKKGAILKRRGIVVLRRPEQLFREAAKL